MAAATKTQITYTGTFPNGETFTMNSKSAKRYTCAIICNNRVKGTWGVWGYRSDATKAQVEKAKEQSFFDNSEWHKTRVDYKFEVVPVTFS